MRSLVVAATLALAGCGADSAATGDPTDPGGGGYDSEVGAELPCPQGDLAGQRQLPGSAWDVGQDRSAGTILVLEAYPAAIRRHAREHAIVAERELALGTW